KKIASLRQVFASGEALTPTQVRLFEELLYNPAGTLLANLYGPTEAAIDVSYFDCFPGNNPDRIPIGKPVDNTTLYVLGAKNELQPVGIAGELYISGVQLARGYINRPGLTAEKFVENPYSPGEKMYKTGDIARWLPNGNIEYLGRTDHQVKIRGFRIELGEIEHHLTSHPALRDAVVQAEGDEADRQLVSYCIPRSPGAYPVLQMLKMKKEDTVKDKKTCELPNGLNIFYLNKNETEFMYNDIFEERCYAQGGITLDDGSVIFDVGANIGLFSLFAHHVCGDARFFAFEPVPAICDVLRLNTELYGVNASIHPIGLGDSSGEATFTYYPNISIMSGRFAKLDEEKKAVKAFLLNSADTENAVTGENQLEEMIQARLVSQEFTCPIKTISEVIRENNIERIDLLKIDVEKSEVSVLKGIDDEDWKKIRQVVLEVHEINGELDWISGTLESHGFRISVDQEEQLTDTGFFNVYAVSEQVLSGSNTAREIPPVSINTLNSPGQLIEHIKKNLKNKLPHYMTPSRFMLMESFPLTASGKLNRTKLKETAFDFSDMAMEYSPPETKTEIQLVEIWKELLAIKKIGITQNFFDLGGHSLKATIMITRIHKEMNVDLPLIRVFTNPTIKMLAAEINSLSQSIYASIEPAPVQDYYPLSSAQKRMFILRQYDEKGTAYNSTSIFKIKGEPDRERLEKVFSRLIERHQPLRTG
ncbi:MAG: FkbM family methyltransferase, partial [bacterium]|nr:FkbM family methyltransferase [bacterium]